MPALYSPILQQVGDQQGFHDNETTSKNGGNDATEGGGAQSAPPLSLALQVNGIHLIIQANTREMSILVAHSSASLVVGLKMAPISKYIF